MGIIIANNVACSTYNGMNNIIALIGFILVLVPVFICIFQLYYDELKKIEKVSERILTTVIIISFVMGVTILYAIGII